MRTAMHVFALVCALTSGYCGATATAATTTTHVRGEGAFALFEDTQGDIHHTVVTVTSTTDRVNESGVGGPVASPLTRVTIFRQDTATGDILLNAEGSTSVHTLNVSNDLQSASVQATVTVFDLVSESFFDVTINLNFASTGEPVTTHSVFKFSEPGFRFQSVFKGTQQAAVATGTVIGLGMNFTPKPSVDAQIQENKSGSFVTTQN